ncbi:MAG: alcohol dehydrogenase catalytic domain-containing protein [Armatimonadetes bacterium]|nr:alcohol dehydrogenase catalytic domain-containing protein [Armatimonadota bacterium]
MTAAVLYGREDVRIERVPVPAVGPGQVLVRIGAALTCGTDLKVWRRGYHARMIVPPAVFGHEFAGTVAAVGPGVEGFRPGMRVVAANSAPCGECFYCRRGAETICEDLLFLNGAYAEYIVVPERIVRKNLLEVPPHLPLHHAAFVEPLACVVRGLDETGISPGDTVAIVGAGPVGLMFILLTRWLGARVIAVGRRLNRLQAAARMGADHVVDDATPEDTVATVRALTEGGRGADRVIECVGLPEVWEQALALVRKGGTVQLFGGCPADTFVRLSTHLIHYGEITIKSAFHHTPGHIRRALELIAGGVINPDALIVGREPLACLPAVLERMASRNGLLKTVIVP